MSWLYILLLGMLLGVFIPSMVMPSIPSMFCGVVMHYAFLVTQEEAHKKIQQKMLELVSKVINVEYVKEVCQDVPTPSKDDVVKILTIGATKCKCFILYAADYLHTKWEASRPAPIAVDLPKQELCSTPVLPSIPTTPCTPSTPLDFKREDLHED